MTRIAMSNVVPVAAILVYSLCAGVLGLRSPGLYYDEAIFFNGAVQVLNSGQEPSFAHDPWSWITIFRHWLPIMVLPYAGALRDYLAVIPFAIFGPGYYSARIITALAGAFGIWGVSVLVRSQAGAKSWPSKRAPGTQQYSDPGPTWRESPHLNS